MSTQEFLVELGTEELPPLALKKLSKAFADGIEAGLKTAELNYGEVKTYASPRRLAVQISDLQTAQEDKVVEKKGPAKKAAFDANGNPTKAVQGFARGCGIEVAELEEVDTPKGLWMVYHQQQKGQPALELLPEIVSKSLAKLPIPKKMRWGSSSIEFVRPVHWLLMLLDEQVIPATILGKTSANTTRGHRFHAPKELVINKPADYVTTLEQQGKVLVDFAQRSELIRQQVATIAKENGGIAVIDENLLEEVTALNEWPQAIVGDFDDEFLSVPAEALISAMKGHQKYFHMLDSNNKLMAKFITISNIASSNPASVKYGNERVIRPRLADAKFFWEKDLKAGLEGFLPRLKKVVFQQKLGTVYDKVQRLEKLTIAIGEPLGGDKTLLAKSARLSKCDLMSEMVGEFTNLQGVMGGYYAHAQNEDAQVVEAIAQQYKPTFAGDSLPLSIVSQSLAIADKLDSITGIFGLGQVPTGDKDPFALRRSALGLVRIIIENELNLNLKELVKHSLSLHPEINTNTATINDIYDFIVSRLKSYYADKGISAEQFEAVRTCGSSYPLDFDKRIEAVKQFSAMAEAESLSAANKRIANILKKVTTELPTKINSKLFSETAEENLYKVINDIADKVSTFSAKKDYTSAMKLLAKVRQPVDEFFDQVMVMVEDKAVQNNRLALLNKTYSSFKQIADISKL